MEVGQSKRNWKKGVGKERPKEGNVARSWETVSFTEKTQTKQNPKQTRKEKIRGKQRMLNYTWYLIMVNININNIVMFTL